MILPVKDHAELLQRYAHEHAVLKELDQRLTRNGLVPKEICACGYRHGHQHLRTRAHGMITLHELRQHYARALCVIWEMECKAAGIPTGMEFSGVGVPLDTPVVEVHPSVEIGASSAPQVLEAE